MCTLSPQGNSFIVEMITAAVFFLSPLKPSSSLEGTRGIILKTSGLDSYFSSLSFDYQSER